MHLSHCGFPGLCAGHWVHVTALFPLGTGPAPCLVCVRNPIGICARSTLVLCVNSAKSSDKQSNRTERIYVWDVVQGIGVLFRHLELTWVWLGLGEACRKLETPVLRDPCLFRQVEQALATAWELFVLSTGSARISSSIWGLLVPVFSSVKS